MLPQLRKQQVSCMDTATRRCSSSQQRQLRHSFAQALPMQCPISLGAMQSKAAMRRTPVLPSTAARDGQMSSSRTTRQIGPATLPLPWGTTTSPVPKLGTRRRLNIPLATRRQKITRSGSSSTTLPCPMTLKLPLSFQRRKFRMHKPPGLVPSSRSPRRTLREETMLQQPPRQQGSCTATVTRRCSSSPQRLQRPSSGQAPTMPCLTS